MRWIRWIAIGLVLVVVAYSAYVGYEGSAQLVGVSSSRGLKSYCFTPEMYAGWDYEAVNYDKSADASLPWVDAGQDLQAAYQAECGDMRGTAGDEIVTEDGIRVAAWYIPAETDIGPTGPTILLVHGNPANKSDMLRYARYLHPDFNLLIPDLRNSGRSGGTVSSTGILEAAEIHSLLDWLIAEKRPTDIGALGDSGGAATILMAARTDDRIDAFVTDSSHAVYEDEIKHVMSTTGNPPHPAYPGIWTMQLGFRIRTGHWFAEADPVDSVSALADRPYLILHGTADHDNHPEVSSEVLYDAAQEAGVPVELQYCEGARHGKLPDTCGEQYGEWVTSFFRRAFEGAGGS